jgi:hypothetical protein
MESNIDHLFHSAYPIPPQHQPFPDSQDQFHRTSHSRPWDHTHHDHQTAPHLYNFYNRPPPSTNDQPPSPPHSDPQPSFPQDPTPPPHALQSSPPIDDEPLYVNAKQYYRILKRRVARARLEEVHRLSQKRKVTSLSRYTPFRVSYLKPTILIADSSCYNSRISMNHVTSTLCVARGAPVAVSSPRTKLLLRRLLHPMPMRGATTTTSTTMQATRRNI